MPGEEFGVGVELGLCGQMDSMPMQDSVLFPVVEFFFNPVTYFKTMVRCHGDIPSIKEFVYVRSKQDAILDPVLSFQLIISTA